MKKNKTSLLQNLFSSKTMDKPNTKIKKNSKSEKRELEQVLETKQKIEKDEKIDKKIDKKQESYEDMVRRFEKEEEIQEKETKIVIDKEEQINLDKEIQKEKQLFKKKLNKKEDSEKPFLSDNESKELEQKAKKLEEKNKKQFPFLFNKKPRRLDEIPKQELKEINKKVALEISKNLKDVDLTDLGYSFIEWSSGGIEYFMNNSGIFGETNLKGFKNSIRHDEKLFKTLLGMAMKDKGSSLYKVLNWCGTRPTKMIMLLYLKNLAQSIYVKDKNVLKEAQKFIK